MTVPAGFDGGLYNADGELLLVALDVTSTEAPPQNCGDAGKKYVKIDYLNIVGVDCRGWQDGLQESLPSVYERYEADNRRLRRALLTMHQLSLDTSLIDALNAAARVLGGKDSPE